MSSSVSLATTWRIRAADVAAARAVLDVVELADDVEQIAVRDRRHFAEAVQAFAVANGAGDGLAVAAGLDQFLALLDRARRHEVLKAGARIARLGPLLVLRHRDDAHADRLLAGAGAFDVTKRMAPSPTKLFGTIAASVTLM